MKKLIFIDNDNERLAQEDSDLVKDRLESAGLSENSVKSLQIISSFHNIEKDEMYKILFSKDNCICTWSMYTGSHFGSLFQMLGLLGAAGRNQIKDMIYLDCSGMIQEVLERNLRERKDVYAILNAIQTNYIITFKEGKPVRLVVDLKGYLESPLKLKTINLSKLVGDKANKK